MVFKVEKFWEAFCALVTWESLGKIYRSKAVNLTICIPFIGYLLLLNDQAAALTLFTAVIDETPAASLVRLYQIYFGLVFLGLASILYMIFCPRVIKENESLHHLFVKEKDNMTITRLNTYAYRAQALLEIPSEPQRDLRELFDRYTKALAIAAEDAHFNNNVSMRKKEIENKSTCDILEMYWNLSNARFLPLKITIFMIYIGGFIFLLLPSISVFAKVLIKLASAGNQ